MCAKRVIFEGFFGKRGVRTGPFRVPKQAKVHLFARRWGGRRAAEGFLGLNRTLCPRRPAPENYPERNAPRATDEKFLRHPAVGRTPTVMATVCVTTR